MTSNGTRTKGRRGFTLIELLVVVGMIAVILGALTTSVSAAQERARVQKATSEVKIITQAILGYENMDRGNDLPSLTDAEANSSSLGFLLGRSGTTISGETAPVLLMASLSSGGTMRDPWGKPYYVTIKQAPSVRVASPFNSLSIGVFLPNFYRLTEEERK